MHAWMQVSNNTNGGVSSENVLLVPREIRQSLKIT